MCVFTCKNPLASCTSEAIEKAEAPPPEGSHATKTWLTFDSGSRTLYTSRLGTRRIMASIDSVPDAFSEPSAEMPSDSRSSIAGSSASNARTVSTFLEESHRGMDASLWRQRSGWSVLRQSSQTRVIFMLSKIALP